MKNTKLKTLDDLTQEEYNMILQRRKEEEESQYYITAPTKVPLWIYYEDEDVSNALYETFTEKEKLALVKKFEKSFEFIKVGTVFKSYDGGRELWEADIKTDTVSLDSKYLDLTKKKQVEIKD